MSSLPETPKQGHSDETNSPGPATPGYPTTTTHSFSPSPLVSFKNEVPNSKPVAVLSPLLEKLLDRCDTKRDQSRFAAPSHENDLSNTAGAVDHVGRNITAELSQPEPVPETEKTEHVAETEKTETKAKAKKVTVTEADEVKETTIEIAPQPETSTNTETDYKTGSSNSSALALYLGTSPSISDVPAVAKSKVRGLNVRNGPRGLKRPGTTSHMKRPGRHVTKKLKPNPVGLDENCPMLSNALRPKPVTNKLKSSSSSSASASAVSRVTKPTSLQNTVRRLTQSAASNRSTSSKLKGFQSSMGGRARGKLKASKLPVPTTRSRIPRPSIPRVF